MIDEDTIRHVRQQLAALVDQIETVLDEVRADDDEDQPNDPNPEDTLKMFGMLDRASGALSLLSHEFIAD